MGWARLDDGYAMHPKLVAAGLEATGLDARVISHCAKYETDGFVTADEATMLATGAKKPGEVIGRLVTVRRWHRVNGSGPTSDCRCLTEHGIDWSAKREAGYIVHDYLVYNDAHAVLESRREKDRIRKGSERMPPRKPNGRRADGGGESGRNPGSPHGRGPGTRAGPVPSRPNHSPSAPSPGTGEPPSGVDDDDEASPTDTPDPTAADVAWLVAERRLAKQRSGTVRSPSGWKRAVVHELLTDERSEAAIGAMLAEGRSADAIAAELEPDLPSDPGVVLRECCGTSVNVPHRMGCEAAAERSWDLDESGVAVRR